MGASSLRFSAIALICIFCVSGIKCQACTPIDFFSDFGETYHMGAGDFISSTSVREQPEGLTLQLQGYYLALMPFAGDKEHLKEHACFPVGFYSLNEEQDTLLRQSTYFSSQLLFQFAGYLEQEESNLADINFSASLSPGPNFVRVGFSGFYPIEDRLGGSPTVEASIYIDNNVCHQSDVLGFYFRTTFSEVCIAFEVNLPDVPPIVYTEGTVQIQDLKFANTLGGLSTSFIFGHEDVSAFSTTTTTSTTTDTTLPPRERERRSDDVSGRRNLTELFSVPLKKRCFQPKRPAREKSC